MSEHTGGTVTYHRAEWIGEKIKPIYPWMVRFMEDGPIHEITAAEGEAMGLTAPEPEPEPLVVECNGHRIELPDDEATAIVEQWAEKTPGDWNSKIVDAAIRLARLLRDARQDPQPTVDTPSDDIDFDALPIGTVLTFQSDSFESTIVRQRGGWRNVANGSEDIPTDPTKWRIAYQPPTLSPRQCLEALLAGRDDADELIEYAARYWRKYEATTSHKHVLLLDAVGDAARGGA